MTNVLLKITQNMLKKGHNLEEIEDKLKKSFSSEKIRFMYDYVAIKQENKQEYHLTFRLSKKLYNKIKSNGKSSSKTIKLALEAYFVRKTR